MARRWKASVAALVLAGAAVAALRRATPRPARASWPANVGHRGLTTRLPENTLAAFRTALEAGAGGLELDVRVTRDGHPVVMHDATVDRTTDGFGTVAGMTLEAVRRLGAGSPGEGIPTLREVFEEFPEARVNIDIKDWDLPSAEKVVLNVLREAGVSDRVLVASADHRVLRRFRRAAGGAFGGGSGRRLGHQRVGPDARGARPRRQRRDDRQARRAGESSGRAGVGMSGRGLSSANSLERRRGIC